MEIKRNKDIEKIKKLAKLDIAKLNYIVTIAELILDEPEVFDKLLYNLEEEKEVFIIKLSDYSKTNIAYYDITVQCLKDLSKDNDKKENFRKNIIKRLER